MLPSRFGILVEAISICEISAWTDNLDFSDQICSQRVFPVKNKTVNFTIELCIFELLWVPNFNLNW